MDATTQILAEAFDIAPIDPSPEALALALSELGYVIKKAPKPRTATPRATVEVFAPNTGNPKVDAFMRKHHRHDWEKHQRRAFASRPGMIAMPAGAPGHPKRPMTQAERAHLYRAHNVVQHSI